MIEAPDLDVARELASCPQGLMWHGRGTLVPRFIAAR